MLANEKLCDRCLGRCFARLGTGLGNDERGRALRVIDAMQPAQTPKRPENCAICCNLFDQIEHWAALCEERAEGVEFSKYLVGTRPPDEVVVAEESLWERYSISEESREPFKQEFNRLAGKRLGQRLDAKGKSVGVDFQNPEVVFTIDLPKNRLQLDIHSLYIYGRYKKLVRTIPQTQWPCRHCKGRGCEICNQTGKQYQESVGELIAAPVLVAAKSNQHAFHGAGREDIDARMLGTGRPFVLEIKSPKIRSLDLQALAEQINKTAGSKVEVGPLKFVSRKVVEDVKEGKAMKSYVARVAFEKPIEEQSLNSALQSLIGEIAQETPHRVLHRRADLTRTRQVFEITGEFISPSEAKITLRCDGGLYVKELISGDQGRTSPSLSALLQNPAKVTELDVIEVIGKFPDSF